MYTIQVKVVKYLGPRKYEVILKIVSRKFGAVLGNYSPEKRAIATLARLMIEEHFYWFVKAFAKNIYSKVV